MLSDFHMNVHVAMRVLRICLMTHSNSTNVTNPRKRIRSEMKQKCCDMISLLARYGEKLRGGRQTTEKATERKMQKHIWNSSASRGASSCVLCVFEKYIPSQIYLSLRESSFMYMFIFIAYVNLKRHSEQKKT